MSDAEKAALEAANFENFLHVGRIDFDGHRSQSPPEPDRIAWRGEQEFGIEITEFHRQDEKRDESEEVRTIEMSFEMYQSRGGPHVVLSAMWASHYKIQRRDRQRLAEKIVDVVLKQHLLDERWLTLDWHDFDRELMLAIDHISIYKPSGNSRGSWTVAGGRSVPKWDVTELQRELDRKKDKPKGYRRRYRETWLLVVSTFGAPSAWMEMTEEVRNRVLLSPFDRVFLLSSFPFKVIELNVAQSPS